MTAMKCYFSYPSSTDVQPIRSLLSDRGIQVTSLAESISLGKNLSKVIRSEIQNCDFVVAVLGNSADVAFEIGFATALKKPIFMVVDDRFHYALQNYVEHSTYAFASPNETGKISYSLDIFLDQIPKKKKSSRHPKPNPAKISGSTLSKQFIANLGDFRQIDPKEFELLVGEIFQELKIDVLAQNDLKDPRFRADYCLWLDELDSSMGNPIIVEVKSAKSESQLANSIDRLSSTARKSLAKLALLIHNNPAIGIRFHEPKNDRESNVFSTTIPLVISISVQDFVDYLSTRTLAETILVLRNKGAHLR